jgi:hypothetical protein
MTVIHCGTIPITATNTNHCTSVIHLQNGEDSGLIKVQQVSRLRPASQMVTLNFDVPRCKTSGSQEADGVLNVNALELLGP